ncbi:hypothetical protein QUB30_08255 [Microcoleus sp. BROC3]
MILFSTVTARERSQKLPINFSGQRGSPNDYPSVTTLLRETLS